MRERITAITQILDEKKTGDIEIFDMRGGEYFVSFVIIAATLGEKHALSLINELKTRLKARGEKFLNVEGSEQWGVIDLGDILIHLLSQKYRGIYRLEELLGGLKKVQTL